ncbi:hypothetical protein XCR_3634 [Xanthomonas campestris pv. raphani 756C]|nr:hypothetical protein XCR_3634 [Xanthomonas campestris pv. raphani 756C]
MEFAHGLIVADRRSCGIFESAPHPNVRKPLPGCRELPDTRG